MEGESLKKEEECDVAQVKIAPQKTEEEKGGGGVAKEDSSEEKRLHRIRLAKTALINLSFIVGLGLSECARGPTLLDLTDIYESTVEEISIFLLISSIGSVSGCFAIGFLMERFPSHHDLLLFGVTCGGGLLSCLYPYCGHLYAFFALMFCCGFMYGSLDAGGNVMCLEIWRGRNGGPYMHSIHFSFSLGAFLAPLIAAPFLSTKSSIAKSLEANGTANVSEVLLTLNEGEDSFSSDSRIGIYFPMVGLATVLVSFGFLYFAVDSARERRRRSGKGENAEEEEKGAKETDGEKEKDASPTTKRSPSFYTFVSLVCVFFFLYVGTEYVFGIYLTAFAVSLPTLELTKVQGTRLAAVFWAAFTAMRFLAIFAAIGMDPAYVMGASFAFCLAGTGAMCFLAQHSFLVLQILTAVVGLGMASVYATGLLWVEQYTPVTRFMGALFTLASSTGPDVLPILVGQFITREPMFMVYLSLGAVSACMVVFAAAHRFAIRVREEGKQKEVEKDENGEESKEML